MRKAIIAIGLSFVGLALILFVIALFMIRSVKLPGDAIIATGTARNVSRYVELDDGVRLAIDIWFPSEAKPGDRLPTLMRSTRYWRAPQIGPLMLFQIALTGTDPIESIPPEIRAFNAAGYAVVMVDVRGSGASFGERPVEFGRQEANDLGEVAGWIAEQPWSNGRVGAWGVSYEGNTSAMSAWSANPALTAIAPQYADFDAWTGLVWPGGVFGKGFIDEWDVMVQSMDSGDICRLAGVDGFMCGVVKLATKGVKRVDGPDGERLYAQALVEHRTPNVSAAAERMEFRDIPFGEGTLTLPELSIGGYREGIERSGVAIFSWSGWMDAGTADGALALFSTFSNPIRTIIGPWSHGGGHHTDPFLPDSAATQPSIADQRQMLIEFFDHYVKNAATTAGEGVGEIRYFTFNEGWKTTASWPPAGLRRTRWYFGEEGGLDATDPAAGIEPDEYKVDFTHTTGDSSRWHTQLGGGDVIYAGRAEQDAKLLTFTSTPLADPVEITGAVEVDLYAASTEDDGAFFAYLEVVDPRGGVRLITEGQLRALHRRPCGGRGGAHVASCHTFAEADAQPLTPGEPMHIRFAMISTSVLVPAGHRIRIALAGHDRSVFDRYPTVGQPVMTLFRDKSRPSGVTIPMRKRASGRS